MEKTRAEVTAAEDTISGEIYIGSGDTEGFRIIAEAARRLREQYPEVRLVESLKICVAINKE